jgi:CRISPR/Cas system CMR-associated protein Cmr5 small subunit
MFLETDYSGFALRGALLQIKNGVLYLVRFISQKLNTTEINYNIYNKEILAVISCLKAWSSELKAYNPFII